MFINFSITVHELFKLTLREAKPFLTPAAGLCFSHVHTITASVTSTSVENPRALRRAVPIDGEAAVVFSEVWLFRIEDRLRSRDLDPLAKLWPPLVIKLELQRSEFELKQVKPTVRAVTSVGPVRGGAPLPR